ncbi:MAG: 4-hydroxybenzoate octaprenyltransferase [Sulfolobaceae archaeon]
MSWDPGGISKRGNKFYVWLRFLRIEQTFFSLPNAYLGAFLAIREIPDVKTLVLIFLALMFLRTAGMTNDNLADREIDALNPRTRNRPLVIGLISVKEAKITIIVSLILFFVTTYFINIYALILSPLVAVIVLTYPYMKRYTAFANYQLALIQGLAVFSGAIASVGNYVGSLIDALERVPWLFVAATIFWAVGFDLYNHIPDREFDKKMGLHSFAVMLNDKALPFAGVNQLLSVVIAIIADIVYKLGIIAYSATFAHALIMAYAYYLATKSNFGKAFFYNIYSSVVLGLGVVIDVIVFS